MQYSIQSAIAPFINIHHNNLDVMQEVDTALLKLERLPAGHALLGKLRQLSTNGKSLKIYASTQFKNITQPALTSAQIATYNLNANNNHQMRSLAYTLCTKFQRHHKGEGTSAIVYFNPATGVQPNKFGEVQQAPNHFGNHFTLGHLLIHAMRMMKGNYQGQDMENYSPNRANQLREENRAMGLGEFFRRPISVNKMREQTGVDQFLIARKV